MDKQLTTLSQQIQEFFVGMFLLIGHDEKEAQEVAGAMLFDIYIEAMTDMINQSDDPEKLLNQMQQVKTKDALQSVMTENFDEDQYLDAISQATNTVMTKYFQEVVPEMSDAHKLLIAEYLQFQQEKVEQ